MKKENLRDLFLITTFFNYIAYAYYSFVLFATRGTDFLLSAQMIGIVTAVLISIILSLIIPLVTVKYKEKRSFLIILILLIIISLASIEIIDIFLSDLFYVLFLRFIVITSFFYLTVTLLDKYFQSNKAITLIFFGQVILVMIGVIFYIIGVFHGIGYTLFFSFPFTITITISYIFRRRSLNKRFSR